jgi:hypothetical protein
VPKAFTVTASSAGCGDYVSETRGLTAFAALDLGGPSNHCAGCGWDAALTQFSRSGEPQPFWAEAERDFYGNRGHISFADTMTIFLVRKPSREEILDALREGRMYAVRAESGKTLRLFDFRVVSGGSEAVSGGTVEAHGPVRVTGTIGSTAREGKLFRAKLISNGRAVREFSGRTPYKFDFTFDAPAGGGYFRLAVDNYRRPALISNPIFVKGKQD